MNQSTRIWYLSAEYESRPWLSQALLFTVGQHKSFDLCCMTKQPQRIPGVTCLSCCLVVSNTHTSAHTLPNDIWDVLLTRACLWVCKCQCVCLELYVSAGQTTGGAPVRLVTRCSVCLHWPLTPSRAFLSSSTLHTILMDINSELSFPDLTYTECVSTALCVCLVLRLNGHVKTVLTPECSSAACSGERFTGWHYSPPIFLSFSLLLWEAGYISLTVSWKLPL